MTIDQHRSLYFAPENLVSFFSRNSQGAAFNNAAPGEGKTHQIVGALPQLLTLYDRVILATSLHANVRELYSRLSAYRPLVRVRRDPVLCGSLNSDWEELRKLELTPLGRKYVCTRCANRDECSWFKADKQTKCGGLWIITHDYLRTFSKELSSKDLVILDEQKFLQFDIQQEIPIQSLCRYLEILQRVDGLVELKKSAQSILNQHKGLPVGRVDPHEYRLLQESLYATRTTDYTRFIRGFTKLLNAPIFLGESVWFSDRIIPSYVPLYVAGYGADGDLLSHFFSRSFKDLSPPSSFRHEHCKVYALRTSSASHSFFRRSESARKGILEFALSIAARNSSLGKRTLFVSKKKLMGLILRDYRSFLPNGSQIYLVPITTPPLVAPDGIRDIPLVSYGLEGINCFERFDSVVCLNSYNLSVEDVSDAMGKLGLGRNWSFEFDRDRNLLTNAPEDKARIFRAYFNYLELNKILQTVGRIRPWGKPSEVFFSGYQQFPEGVVFSTVADAKRAFGFDRSTQLAAQCKCLRRAGYRRAEIAEKLGVSVRTVSRFWKEGVHENCSAK